MPARMVSALLLPALLLLAVPGRISSTGYSSDFYRNRLRYSPDFYHYQHSYILALIKEGKAPAARQYLDRWRTEGSNREGRFLLLEGLLLAHTGHPDRAKESWRRFWPHAGAEYQLLDREYRTLQMTAEQVAFFRYLAGRHPADTRILQYSLSHELTARHFPEAVQRLAALAATRQGLPDSMDRMLLQALPEARDRETLLRLLAARHDRLGLLHVGMLLQLDRNREAATALLGLYRKRHLTAADAARRARILYERGALPLFLQVMAALPPDGPQPAERLLHARALERDAPERAGAIYRSLSGMDDARRGLARLHFRKGRYREAGEELAAVRLRSPEDSILAGKLHTLQGALPKAVAWFRGLPQPEQGVHIALALLITGKDNAEARQPLLEALRTIKGDGSALPGLELLYQIQYYRLAPAERKTAALALRQLWQEDTAGAAMTLATLAAERKDMTGSRIRLHAAALAFQAARTDLAVALLRKTIALQGPLTDRALYLLARHCKYTLGDKQEAERLFLQLVEKYPASLYLYESRRELTP